MKEMSQCCFKCDHYSVIMCACLWACVQSYNVRLLEEFRDQFNEIVTKMNFKFKLWTTFNSIVQPNCDISFSFKKIIHLIELRTFKHFITLIWWENATVPPNTIIIIVNKKNSIKKIRKIFKHGFSLCGYVDSHRGSGKTINVWIYWLILQRQCIIVCSNRFWEISEEKLNVTWSFSMQKWEMTHYKDSMLHLLFGESNKPPQNTKTSSKMW